MLIPVGRQCDYATIAVIKDKLAACVPAWSSLEISGSGTYLGIVIGPDAALLEWDSTLTRLASRVRAIATGRHSPAVSALLYVRMAAPMGLPSSPTRRSS